MRRPRVCTYHCRPHRRRVRSFSHIPLPACAASPRVVHACKPGALMVFITPALVTIRRKSTSMSSGPKSGRPRKLGQPLPYSVAAVARIAASAPKRCSEGDDSHRRWARAPGLPRALTIVSSLPSGACCCSGRRALQALAPACGAAAWLANPSAPSPSGSLRRIATRLTAFGERGASAQRTSSAAQKVPLLARPYPCFGPRRRSNR